MTQYSVPIPPMFRLDEDDAGIVHDYLTNKGYVVSGVSINLKDRLIIVEAETDPTNEITAYQPPVTPRQRAREAFQELNVIDFDTADIATLRRSLKLIRALLVYEFKKP